MHINGKHYLLQPNHEWQYLDNGGTTRYVNCFNGNIIYLYNNIVLIDLLLIKLI